MSYSKITLENKEGIYYMGFGKNEEKSMTVIYKETLEEMNEALDKIASDKDSRGLVLFSHKKNCFLAGMDISVIQGLKTEVEASDGCEKGQAVFNKIEDLKVPTLALVDGVCLGGGCEMVLACDKIIASDNPKTAIGLPEVLIGVLPGFGGTYRLPKRVGITGALDMVLTGKQIKAKKAKKIGLVDEVMPVERLLPLAPEYLFKKVEKKKSFSESMTDMASDNFIARKVIFQKAREKVLETTKGFYPAPLKILDHLEASYGKKRSKYLAKEAKTFGELTQTSQSKNLQHVFFLHDESKKMNFDGEVKKIDRGAVLGAGVMGGGSHGYLLRMIKLQL